MKAKKGKYGTMRASLLYFMVLLACSVFVSATWNNQDLNLFHDADISNPFLNTTFSNETLTNCNLEFQPLSVDINLDGTNEIIVYCENTNLLRILSSNGTVLSSTNIGNLDGYGAVLQNSTAGHFSAVVGGNLKIWQIGNSSITETYSSVVPFDNVYCGSFDGIVGCYDIPILTTIGFFDSSVDYDICVFNDTAVTGFEQTVECYDDIEFQNLEHSFVLDGTLKICSDFRKISTWVGWGSGGFDSVVVWCSNTVSKYITTWQLDSDLSNINRKSVLGSDQNVNTNGFLYNEYFCHIISGSTTQQQIFCYDNTGTEQVNWLISDNDRFSDGESSNPYANNIVIVDYDNDGTQDIMTNTGVFDIIAKVEKVHNDPPPDDYFLTVTDMDADGSTDYVFTDDSNGVIQFLTDYTNLPPSFDKLSWDTGEPICINSLVTYTIEYTDPENNLVSTRVDCLGNGSFTSWSLLTAFPDEQCIYSQLGGFTTLFEMKDNTGSTSRLNKSVVIATVESNCYATGENPGNNLETGGASTGRFGGFIIGEPSGVNGYTPKTSLYNDSNYVHFDQQRCIDEYGEEWRTLFIPCPVRLVVIDAIEVVKGWIFDLFTYTLVAVIIILSILAIKKLKS